MHRDRRTTEDAGAEQESARPAVPPAPPAIGDYFEDEMRGYRLLKASRLNREEKQHVLTQTGNTTHFNAIRVALRTLFAEDELPRRDRKSRIWWNDFGNEYDENEEWDAFYGQDHWEDQWYEPNYWNDEWNEWDSYDDWYGTQEINALDESSGDVLPDESQDGAEEAQYREAFALAAEANKTMREAKEAVRRTRIARGYYAPESSSGKGIVGMGSKSGGSPSHKGKGSGSSSSHSGKGRTMGFGPCFICGKDTHGYRQCPDRFSKGFSKGGKKGFKGKGKFGKSKFKGKGTAHFVDIHLNVLAAQWDDSAVHGRAPTRAIIDTGATENAIGINSLHDLVVTGGFAYDVCQDNLPTFRFGNGHSDSAKSRVDIHGTSLGSISFYVLDGMASSTPPLIGSRTLRSKQVLVSYLNGMFLFRNNSWKQDEVMAIQMQALQSGHLTIDFSERPSPVTIDIPRLKGNEWNRTDQGKCSDWTEGNQTQRMVHIYMLRKEPDFVSSKGCDLRDRLQSLAQRLHQVQRRHPDHQHVFDSSSPRRSSSNRVPMFQEACGRKSEEQSAWDMADLPEMCSSPQLSHQERHGWRVSPNGATSSLGHIGPGSLEKEMDAAQVDEKIFNGKLMELKGKMLQQGLTQTMAVNLTLEEYRHRLSLENKVDPIVEAEAQAVKEKGKKGKSKVKIPDPIQKSLDAIQPAITSAPYPKSAAMGSEGLNGAILAAPKQIAKPKVKSEPKSPEVMVDADVMVVVTDSEEEKTGGH